MMEDEYEERINELLDQYGDKLTVMGAKREQIRRASNVLEDYAERTGNSVPYLNSKNYKHYNDLIAKAGRMTAEFKGRGGSDVFYQILDELIAEE
jgi:hypothetical protein